MLMKGIAGKHTLCTFVEQPAVAAVPMRRETEALDTRLSSLRRAHETALLTSSRRLQLLVSTSHALRNRQRGVEGPASTHPPILS